MSDTPAILLVGTFDTKADELDYLVAKIEAQGGRVVSMDVSVLGEPRGPVSISKHRVAEAAGASIAAAIAAQDENVAMQIMARGAAALTRALHAAGEIEGMLALGGSMGTDLALDCARALPMGAPKVIVSTIAFSPLIPADRLAADVQMILWAGGLYGLNSLCRASLSQAAGAVVGAARAVEPPRPDRPLIGMTSLGKSCLSYMARLKPALEARGYELSVFHATGMGGRAFESLAAEGAFACVMDFCVQEFSNGVHGSPINSGADRLLSAGRAGVPQIVAPGASDLVDLPGWTPVPQKWRDRPFHAHNRLIASVAVSPDERRQTARAMADSLAQAQGPVTVILPAGGVEEWDRPGQPAHDPEGLTAFCAELRAALRPPAGLIETEAHINDAGFAETALAVLDDWRARGLVQPGRL